MSLERDMSHAFRGVTDDLAEIGREIRGPLLRFWPFLLSLGLLAGAYLYIAFRTHAGFTGAAIIVGFVAVVILGFTWRRLVRLHRRSVMRARWDAAVSTVKLPPTRVEEVDVAHGRLTVRVTGGIAVDDLGNKVRQLEAALGERLRIEYDRDHPGRAFVILSPGEPFAGGTKRAWPGLSEDSLSLWNPIPFGIDEYGDLVSLSLVGRHLLIGGMTGGGKSVALSAICATAANDPHARLYLFDPKRLELAIWERCAAGSVDGPDLGRATDLLREIRRELDRRTAMLKAKTEAADVPVREIPRDPAMPLCAVIIDELAEYTDRGRDSADFSNLLRSLVAMGRAVGIIVIAATQKPQGSVVPTELRDLFPYRFALRCGTPQMSETVLGQGWASRGADASRLPDRPGLGFLLADEALPRRVRTFANSDEDLATLARQARERRGLPKSGITSN